MEEKEIQEIFGDEPIELVDEDGNVIKFKVVDVTEFKGDRYVLLIPAEPNEQIAEDELLIFLYNEEEQSLDVIEDDDLLDAIYDNYLNEADEELN
jgi:hypothetical protein